ncbi:hypothetical protein L596_017366 [Steinernema carpocapsae]|uniref:F-box domain-containing protein n=1 Tax=Steinernema carpocapsae TaxID=34508 RepID=A0A4U5N1G4_STECR|nr:hypothetical protein L596_017366 [Steinernema carpocapsae]
MVMEIIISLFAVACFILASWFYYYKIRPPNCSIANLPPEMLFLILSHLKQLENDCEFYRHRTVCRQWKPLVEELADPVPTVLYWEPNNKRCSTMFKSRFSWFHVKLNENVDPKLFSLIPKTGELNLHVTIGKQEENLVNLLEGIKNIRFAKPPEHFSVFAVFNCPLKLFKQFLASPMLEKATEIRIYFPDESRFRNAFDQKMPSFTKLQRPHKMIYEDGYDEVNAYLGFPEKLAGFTWADS